MGHFSLRLPKDLETVIAEEASRQGIARSAALIHLARLGMEVRGLMEASAEIRTLAPRFERWRPGSSPYSGRWTRWTRASGGSLDDWPMGGRDGIPQ